MNITMNCCPCNFYRLKMKKKKIRPDKIAIDYHIIKLFQVNIFSVLNLSFVNIINNTCHAEHLNVLFLNSPTKQKKKKPTLFISVRHLLASAHFLICNKRDAISMPK